MVSFTRKMDMLYSLGCSRNWHPKHVVREKCGQYYMTGNSNVDGKVMTINIELICKHKGIPFSNKEVPILCDKLYIVLLTNLNYRFRGTEIRMCDNNYKLIKTYQIG